LSQCSSECLLATLNCSSAGGGPSVAQNKMPKSVAEKIMMAISLKYIGLTPTDTLHKNSRRLLGGEF
jgi:hypothetical protein